MGGECSVNGCFLSTVLYVGIPKVVEDGIGIVCEGSFVIYPYMTKMEGLVLLSMDWFFFYGLVLLSAIIMVVN